MLMPPPLTLTRWAISGPQVRAFYLRNELQRPQLQEATVRTIATLESRIVRSESTGPTGGRMIDVKTADRELQLYVRPQTFPVAIRMLRPGEAIPERARRPARDFKKLSMNCQVIDMARRYGWMIA